MTEAVLVLDNLVKDFERKRAVDHISLELKRGEILGLLGPNGAGKTTTMRMVMDIIAPDSGKIEIFGEAFCENTKNRIGYLPEERGLYRKLKVSETLTFFGELKAMKTKDIQSKGLQLLERFTLSDYLDKRVEELSKGMAQKLQIITTILHSPELLIFDEPFAGLDPVNIELVKDIILEHKRAGKSIILSSHLMEYAEKIVDSVVMINGGKKVLDGTLAQIKANYGTRFVKINYDGDASFMSSLSYLKNIKDYGKELEIELKDIQFKDQLIRDIVKNLSINSFKITEPSLNNIFIRKVNKDIQT